VTQILEIAPLLARYPQTLSGGERQRVALARALMTQPRLLLMDEPLSAVQADLRHRILPYLKRIREQFHIPIVYVTHDPGDVMALGEEVVVMEEGRVTAQGSPVTLLHQPVFLRRVLQGPLDNSFAAEVVHNKPDLGVTQVRTEKGLMLLIPNQKEDPRTSLRLGIPAEDILIAVSAPEGLSARNIFPGKIDQMEAAAGTVLLRVEALETFLVRLSGSAAENLHLHVGQTVHLIVKSHSIHLL
jgi:molybdate transport system ATP-binding protein